MSKETADIFIAASPFQLLNVTEAAGHFNDGHPKILILMESYLTNAMASVEELLTFFKWDHIKRIKTNDKLGFLKQVWYVLLHHRMQVRHLFIADYKGWFFQIPMALNLRRKGKLFLVDDGAATIVLQHNYLPQRKIYEYKEMKKQDEIKKKLFRLLNLKTQLQDTVNLFSIFDFAPFDGQQYVRNEMNLLKSRKAEDNSGEAQSIFIGAGLVEDGHMDETAYLNSVKAAQEKVNQQLIYYPHRCESARMMDLIAAIPGVVVRKNKYFIELELILNKVVPRNIVSFWSTSLYTLHQLFPDAVLYFLKLEREQFKRDYYDEISLVYDHYEKYLPLTLLDVPES